MLGDGADLSRSSEHTLRRCDGRHFKDPIVVSKGVHGLAANKRMEPATVLALGGLGLKSLTGPLGAGDCRES